MDKRTIAIALLVAAVLVLVLAGLASSQSLPSAYEPLPCDAAGYVKYHTTEHLSTSGGYRIYFDQARTFNETRCSGQPSGCRNVSYLYAGFHFTDRKYMPLEVDYTSNMLFPSTSGYPGFSVSQEYPFYVYDLEGNWITLQVCPVPGDEKAIYAKVTEQPRSAYGVLRGTHENNTDCPSLDSPLEYGGYEFHNMGQWMRAGSWTVTPIAVLLGQTQNDVWQVTFDLKDQDGRHVDFLNIPKNGSFIFRQPYDEEDYSIDLCRIAPGGVGINSRWAEFRVVQRTNNSANASTHLSCNATPGISVEPQSLRLSQGGVGRVKLIVRGTQPASCGRQMYGVDFTNAYDASLFSLGIADVKGENKFYLWSGEVREFDGLVGATGAIYSGKYALQVTAYSDADHWKQASKNIAVQVSEGVADGTYWKTPVTIGWNAIPYVEGLGAYGCPDISEAYAYVVSLQKYVKLNRYGPIFSLSNATYAYSQPERYGGLFVFSKERCSVESRVEKSEFANSKIWLFEGQLLTLPPAWNGTTLASIANACIPQVSHTALEASTWDAGRQQWIALGQSDPLESGKAYRISSSTACVLGADAKPG